MNDFDIINPKRISWDDSRDNDEVSKEQIIWEKNYIDSSDYILFWFPKETLCPITLFELGAALHTKNIACIGIHPEYQRKLDIEVQTSLVNKNIPIKYSLDDMISSVINHIKDN